MENWNVFESPVPLKEYKLTPGVQIRVRSKTFGRLHIAPEEQEGEAEGCATIAACTLIPW